MKKLILLSTMFMTLSVWANEVFFECEVSLLDRSSGEPFKAPSTIDNKPWIRKYSVDMNTKTGTFTENRSDWHDFLNKNNWGTTKKVSVDLSSDSLFLNYCQTDDDCSEYGSFSINRETLELSQGGEFYKPPVYEGLCKIIEKNNQF